jgi:cytochrome oxidase assembly protein ShyY1
MPALPGMDEIESTLLGLWLGAALLFSAVVAPNVFLVLRGFDLANANEIAGTIVTRTLSVINVGGFAVGLLSLVILGLTKRPRKGPSFIAELISLALLATATGVGQWVVAARMRALRTAMVTIDLVPANDPRRVSFNNLHHYSVQLMGLAMIVAAVAFIMSRRRIRLSQSGGSHA